MTLSPLVRDALGSLAQYIQAPRTELPVREWLAQKYNWYPHAGQEPVFVEIERALGQEGYVNEIDLVCGKRAGKTELVIRLALYLTLGLSRRGWVLAPTERLAGRIFKPLFQMIEASDVPILEANESEMRIITSTGGVLEGMTWGNPKQIEGEGIEFCICDESQQLTDDIHSRISARLVGNYLWLRIGSPAEEGCSFYEEHALELSGVLPNHRMYRWPTWLNPDAKIQQMLRIERNNLRALRQELGPDHPAYKQRLGLFLRVYGGKSARPSDLVVSSFDEAVQVRPCPFDADLPVYLFVDPGWSPAHYAVCAYQPHPKGEALGVEVHPQQDELWQIDELYVQHTVTEDVIRELKGREWWANVEKAVIDVAARQTNRQTGMREIDVWTSLTPFPVLSQYVNLNESVGALRSWCAASRIFHDPAKCPHTIKEYSLWKMTKGSRDIPGDDWNDALQATSYGLVKLYGHIDAPTEPIVWRRAVNTVNRRWAWN